MLAYLTGAAGGVGRVTAERFAKDGWDLVLIDVVDSVNDVAAEVVKASGRKVVGVKTDITQEGSLASIDAALRGFGGQLEFLGLVAAVQQKFGPIETLDLAESDRVFNINVRANMILIKHFAP